MFKLLAKLQLHTLRIIKEVRDGRLIFMMGALKGVDAMRCALGLSWGRGLFFDKCDG